MLMANCIVVVVVVVVVVMEIDSSTLMGIKSSAGAEGVIRNDVTGSVVGERRPQNVSCKGPMHRMLESLCTMQGTPAPWGVETEWLPGIATVRGCNCHTCTCTPLPCLGTQRRYTGWGPI